MKAMILAAGLGTRLRPLTDDLPKALVKIGGRTLLEITLARLRSFGIREVIINTHHQADKISLYLKENRDFGMHIVVSQEDVLLDTGGGLKKAGWFFDEEAFVLHNVDVLSSIDLRRMARFHLERQALATLAVQERPTSRYLLFDEDLCLCGRRSNATPKDEIVRPSKHLLALAFSGIHVISPRLLPLMSEHGSYSIITTYLDLASRGEPIAAFRADDYYWRDLGKPQDLMEAEADLKAGKIVLV